MIKDSREARFVHHAALGLAVSAWSDLHEMLALLFSVTLHPDRRISEPVLKAWHSLKNDRAQRLMLRVAAEATFNEHKTFPKAAADIDWLIVQADKLHDQRNDAVHAPISADLYESDSGELHVVVAGFETLHNPRAKKLNNWSDILSVLEYSADCANRLSSYTRAVISALDGLDGATWADRPTLPQQPAKKA